MFYLKSLLQIFKQSKTRATLFVIATMICLAFVGNTNKFQRYFKGDLGNSYDSFSFIVENKVISSRVLKSIRDLPGVTRVNVKKDVEKHKNKILSNLGLDGEFYQNHFSAFVVRMKRGVNPKAVTLIQQYIAKLIGKKDVTFTKIKKGSSHKTEHSFLSSYGHYLVAIGCFFFWLVFANIILIRIHEYSFIIEQFQRKKNVGRKIFLVITSVTTFSLGLMSIFMKDFSLFSATLFFFILCSMLYLAGREKIYL